MCGNFFRNELVEREGCVYVRRLDIGMKVLVVGSGGREHALVWKLTQSPQITQMWCAPGNAGIAQERLKNGAVVECVALGAEDLAALRKFAQEHRVGLTVVGPDNPLALGIVDYFKDAGLRIWGPNKRAAEFESSKVFSQDFMERHGIPTARSGSFTEPGPALKFAESLHGKCAVKADGLALGKGVLICGSVLEAKAAIEELLLREAFGAAGRRIVIQEFLEGIEVSLHALCDGVTAKLFPTSQDHKRALDGDEGLNTGGMGTYSPAPFLSDQEASAVGEAILTPWLAGCREEGIDYCGLLYPGVMLTSKGPKVLEFNARFGDPETQVYMMRLQSDLLELFEASIDRTLAQQTLRWTDEAAVCVVMASGGYPGNYEKGAEITGLDAAGEMPGVKVFHAGTALKNGRVVTNGGRVLGVTALGPGIRPARDTAYNAVNRIQFNGAQYRKDIAAKALRISG